MNVWPLQIDFECRLTWNTTKFLFEKNPNSPKQGVSPIVLSISDSVLRPASVTRFRISFETGSEYQIKPKKKNKKKLKAKRPSFSRRVLHVFARCNSTRFPLSPVRHKRAGKTVKMSFSRQLQLSGGAVLPEPQRGLPLGPELLAHHADRGHFLGVLLDGRGLGARSDHARGDHAAGGRIAVVGCVVGSTTLVNKYDRVTDGERSSGTLFTERSRFRTFRFFRFRPYRFYNDVFVLFIRLSTSRWKRNTRLLQNEFIYAVLLCVRYTVKVKSVMDCGPK